MTTRDNHPLAHAGAPSPAARDVVRLLTGARTASLATLDHATGHPYVSLVTVALDVNGAPLMLLSTLARHTQNLKADPRASALFTPSDVAAGDPLATARVTVIGLVKPTPSPTAKPQFLANHPDAQMYVSFADFAFFALAPANAHFIGGFGRIIDIPGAELISAVESANQRGV